MLRSHSSLPRNEQNLRSVCCASSPAYPGPRQIFLKTIAASSLTSRKESISRFAKRPNATCAIPYRPWRIAREAPSTGSGRPERPATALRCSRLPCLTGSVTPTANAARRLLVECLGSKDLVLVLVALVNHLDLRHHCLVNGSLTSLCCRGAARFTGGLARMMIFCRRGKSPRRARAYFLQA